MDNVVLGVRSIELEMCDLARAAEFFTKVWHLSVVAEGGGSVFLRGTGSYHHILALHEAERQTAARRIVFDARDRGAIDSFYDRLKTRALRCNSPSALSARAGGTASSLSTPRDAVSELFAASKITRPRTRRIAPARSRM